MKGKKNNRIYIILISFFVAAHIFFSAARVNAAGWYILPGISEDKVQNWVGEQVPKLFDFGNQKLGSEVGDYISKQITLPSFFSIMPNSNMNGWNKNFALALGKSSQINGYTNYTNFSFSHPNDITVSLSGSDSDKVRTITIKRVKKSTTSTYIIKVDYNFSGKGIYADGMTAWINGVYYHVEPSGPGKTITGSIGAVPAVMMTATAVPTTINKGDNLNLTSLVTNVRYGDYEYSPGYYNVDLENTLDLETPGVKIADLKISSKESPTTRYGYISVPVTVIDNKITAEPIPQTKNLGTDMDTVDYSSFVKDVKLGSQSLSPDKYGVTPQNKISTQTIGIKNNTVRVSLKSDASKYIDLEVPVNVMWGQSIVFGSYDYGGNGRTSASFSLFTGTSPSIVASEGVGDDNKAIHSVFPTQTYYKFDWFNLSNLNNLMLDDNTIGNASLVANGGELKQDKLKEWGTNQRQAVNYGDIVRAWQKETNKNWLYVNEVKQTFNEGKQAVYYEITTAGYKGLHFNQLASKTSSIPIYTTNGYLDTHISEYIDLKGNSNIRIKGFTQYPNTKVSGTQIGKITIEETLTTGKKIQYNYNVPFTVTPGSLNFSVPGELAFSDFTKSRNEQIVKRKSETSPGLVVKDSRGSNSQGNWSIAAKVKNSTDVMAPYLIYRNKNGIDSYLNNAQVMIYSQEKQVNAEKPLEIDISSGWENTSGILLKVPSKNNFSSGAYTTTISWNLVEGP